MSIHLLLQKGLYWSYHMYMNLFARVNPCTARISPWCFFPLFLLSSFCLKCLFNTKLVLMALGISNPIDIRQIATAKASSKGSESNARLWSSNSVSFLIFISSIISDSVKVVDVVPVYTFFIASPLSHATGRRQVLFTSCQQSSFSVWSSKNPSSCSSLHAVWLSGWTRSSGAGTFPKNSKTCRTFSIASSDELIFNAFSFDIF